MSYKIGANTIIDLDRQGVFNAVYFKNDTYDMADTDGFKEGSNTWFSSTGNVSVTKLSTNTFLQYTQATGFNYGYVSGGVPTAVSNVIDRFPFAVATTNATDVGDLTVGRFGTSGQSSSSHGYTSSGDAPSVPGISNVIDRFPFAAATTNATDVGNLTVARTQTAGQSSVTHGYTSGGTIPSFSNVIDRFPFAVATVDATDVGDLTVARLGPAGQSSSTHGYSSGGSSPTASNVIDRFPFAVATTNATDVGDLTVARRQSAGLSSGSHGYTSGGTIPSFSNVIDRFPFAAATTNAVDNGDLTLARTGPAGQSSVENGYSSGGENPLATYSNVIDRKNFSSSANATDVGDLSINRGWSAGQQY